MLFRDSFSAIPRFSNLSDLSITLEANMPEQKLAWWRDPRFVIPSIAVPLLLALVALVPSLFKHRISDELSVSFVVSDARRTTRSVFDIPIGGQFTAREASGSDAARVIADQLTTKLQNRLSNLLGEREPIEVLVLHGEDGTLSIGGSVNTFVSLHLSRFDGVTHIGDVGPKSVQMTLAEASQELSFSESASETSFADLKMKAGVYRIVLTAPGYRDEARYLQLTDAGEVLTSDPWGEVSEVRFPIAMKLFPRFQTNAATMALDGLRIALGSCNSVAPALSTAKFQDMGTALESALLSSLRDRGFNAVPIKAGQRVSFDLNESKNLPAPKGLLRSDLVIERCRVEWID